MAKKSRAKADAGAKSCKSEAQVTQPFLLLEDAVDPSLELLFASSVSCPVDAAIYTLLFTM